MTAQDAASVAAEVPPAPGEMHHLAQWVAVTEVRLDDARAANILARRTAAARFALARRLGVKQQAVLLPGGTEAGLLALKRGARTIEVNEDELLLLIAAALPSEVEDYATDCAYTDPRAVELLAEHCPDLTEMRLKPGALSDERALKVLAEHAPDLVNLRIKPAQRAELQSYLEAHEGTVPDPSTGEPVKVAEITQHDPTGDFSWTDKTKYLGRVREALESGRLVITANGDVAETVAGEVVAPEAIEGGEAE